MQRREFLTLFAGAVFPSEQKRYPDPATELEVLRLTDPEHTSFLPRHAASRRGNFLLYANDRSGSMQVCRMDLKTGESRQLTEAEALDAASLTLLPDDRGFVFCDGDRLRMAQIGGKIREVGSIAPLLLVAVFCWLAWVRSLLRRPCAKHQASLLLSVRSEHKSCMFVLTGRLGW